MTKQEVMDALRTELSKTYTIRTTTFENGQAAHTDDTSFPNQYLNFNRDIIETALMLLEDKNDA